MTPAARAVTLAALAVWLPAGTARAEPNAGPGASAADKLSRAVAALQRGEYDRAADLAGAIARRAGAAGPPGSPLAGGDPAIAPQDRAEAWRLYALSLFYKRDRARAEAAFLEYLKLEEKAHLDPAIVPPEVIVFFEDVRARNAADIRAYHPPDTTRYALLNFAPPAGQFQNGDSGKGWAIAVSGAALIAINVGTYATLRWWCDDSLQCGERDERFGAARALRAVNLASAIGVGALYTYGVVDGFWSAPGDADVSVAVMPVGAPTVAVGGRF